MIIGVYDSGIGGLTTLSWLIRTCSNCDFYYYADNANMPFGNRTDDDVKRIVKNAMKHLEENSDIQVIACNTASTVTNLETAFLLKPEIKNLNPETTLVLGTPKTIEKIRANELLFNTYPTKNLATLVEICASLAFKQKIFDFSILTDYISDIATLNDSIETVVLGCSHYAYLYRIFRHFFPSAKIVDGNENLANMVKRKTIYSHSNGKIRFAFSGVNETKKYEWILSKLLDNNF